MIDTGARAAHYRRKAEEVRAIAEAIADTSSRRILMTVAHRLRHARPLGRKHLPSRSDSGERVGEGRTTRPSLTAMLAGNDRLLAAIRHLEALS